MTRNTRRKLQGLGVLLVPALLVKGTALLLGNPTAQSSSAAQEHDSADVTAITPLVKIEMTEQQIRLAEHIASQHEQPFGESPMHYNAPIAADPSDSRAAPPPGEFDVQAVLGSAAGNKTLVNGKLYQVGDTIAGTSWVISVIDASTRSVTLRNEATGEERSQAVNTPAAGSMQ